MTILQKLMSNFTASIFGGFKQFDTSLGTAEWEADIAANRVLCIVLLD